MRLLFFFIFAFVCAPAMAQESFRVATYDVGMTRSGAGVLLRDLQEKPDEKIKAAVAVIQAVRPDILLLTGFDHDATGRALDAFRSLLAGGDAGIDYPHSYNGPLNAGEPSGLDLDGDGLLAGWADNWGWGKFPGHGGMALLSRYPVVAENVRIFNTFLWRDLPGALEPVQEDGRPWPSAEAAEVRRLSSRGHWQVPVRVPGGVITLLASNPTPPLFDGPEGANAKRNRDEIRFWAEYLAGNAFADDAGNEAGLPETPLILLGNLNKDPEDGAGEADAIAALVETGRLNDVKPASQGGRVGGRGTGRPEHRPCDTPRVGHGRLARRRRAGEPAGGLCSA